MTTDLHQKTIMEDPSIDDKVEEQCVQQLYINAQRSVPFHTYLSLIVVIILWSHIDESLLLSWFTLMNLLTLGRLFHVRHVININAVAQNAALMKRIFLISALSSGALWGAGFIIIGAQSDETYRLLFILVLGGMASGGVSSMSSSRQVFIAYLLPILSPAMVISLLQGDAVGYGFASILLLFMIMLITTQNIAYQTLVNNFHLRFDNEDLIKKLSNTNQQLQLAQEKLEAASLTDPLTGLSNRRHFDQLFNYHWNHAKRYGEPLSCLMIDIDLFKGYNDHYGHQKGDACLQAVTNVLRKSIRRTQDIIARYGGEEFVVILPNTTYLGASSIAEQLLHNVREANIDNAAAPECKVTVSIGVACYNHITSQLPDTLIKAADDALYRAKNNGRNRIEVNPTNTLQPT